MEAIIKIGDSELIVEFDYQPEEPQEWEYPGCDEELTATSVFFEGVDIMDIIESLGNIEYVEELALKEFKKY